MRRLLLLTLALALAALIPFLIWGGEIEAALSVERMVDRLRAAGPWGAALAVALLTLDLLAPIPASAVMAALGIVYGPWLGGALSTLGATLSGLTGYGLCRAFGQPLAERLAGREGLAAARTLFARGGGWLVALSRWLPVLPETVACLAGLAAMPPRRFLAALLCGTAPMGFAFAAAGWMGRETPVVTLLIAALVPLALWALFSRFLPAPVSNNRRQKP